MTTLSATMDGKSWTETPLEVPEALAEHAPKLTRVVTERTFSGDLEGAGVAYYQMVHHPKPEGETDAHHASARFSGLQYFSGSIKGVGKGTIALIDTGSYSLETGAVSEWVSDPKSGTGDLAGLKAKGGYVAKGMTGNPVSFEIEK